MAVMVDAADAEANNMLPETALYLGELFGNLGVEKVKRENDGDDRVAYGLGIAMDEIMKLMPPRN